MFAECLGGWSKTKKLPNTIRVLVPQLERQHAKNGTRPQHSISASSRFCIARFQPNIELKYNNRTHTCSTSSTELLHKLDKTSAQIGYMQPIEAFQDACLPSQQDIRMSFPQCAQNLHCWFVKYLVGICILQWPQNTGICSSILAALATSRSLMPPNRDGPSGTAISSTASRNKTSP